MSVIKLAKDLGKLKMVSSKDPKEHAKAKDAFDAGFLMLEKLFKVAGAEVFYIDGNGTKHSSVQKVQTPYKTIVAAKGNPQKIFTGHIDVVSAEENQFEPKHIEGHYDEKEKDEPYWDPYDNYVSEKLIFRGACDMLGPVAAMTQAFAETKADNVLFALSDSGELGKKPGGIVTFVDLYKNLLKQHTRFVLSPDNGHPTHTSIKIISELLQGSEIPVGCKINSKGILEPHTLTNTEIEIIYSEKIPAVFIGHYPYGSGGAHEDNEWMNVNAINDLFYIFCASLKNGLLDFKKITTPDCRPPSRGG